ncbi:hypothetical protein G6F60_014584 [Rhizopus arrhizus]|nr:hypothetical protein G6F60_014584 [Rhizopus arrhizus]
MLGLDRDTAMLTAAGSAICGAAAVLAFEPTLRAAPHKSAVAVATVVLFGTLSMRLASTSAAPSMKWRRSSAPPAISTPPPPKSPPSSR